MEHTNEEMQQWLKSVVLPDLLNNWKVETPAGEKTVMEYFAETEAAQLRAMRETPTYKRLNLYEDLITKFPLADIRKKREAGETLTFLEWVVVHYHYKKAADAISVIACDREGLSALAKEFLDIAESAKKNSLAIPLDVINAQIKEVVPYMVKV